MVLATVSRGQRDPHESITAWKHIAEAEVIRRAVHDYLERPRAS